jgi:colicin import membrane protein
MIRAALEWMRAQAGPLGLSVVLHIALGALLVLGTVINGANPQDAPGRGSTHRPIQAVVVNASDYQAAESVIKQARQAREAHAKRLQAEAANAKKARARAEQELAQLRRQKQSTAMDVTHTQQQLASQSQQLQKLKSQAAKMAQERAAYQKNIARLKVDAEQAQKAQVEEKARLAKARAAAEAARKVQVQAQMQAEQERELSKDRGNWVAAIQRRIIANWIRPPNTLPGLDCFVTITQLPSGQVVNAVMQQCNGDAVTRQSIITAVRKASPLPTPANPAVFSRRITFEFAPDQS